MAPSAAATKTTRPPPTSIEAPPASSPAASVSAQVSKGCRFLRISASRRYASSSDTSVSSELMSSTSLKTAASRV
ncbi:hypothetical protein EES44_02725 [Streptomyces sp. ADI96-15]|nr:hypothetical protein EES44_02725 [Streptomyces sp. ADI96-15]